MSTPREINPYPAWRRPNGRVVRDSRRFWADLWMVQGGLCGGCGQLMDDLGAVEVDHIVPRRLGVPPVPMGFDGPPPNLQAMHGPCNAAKGGHLAGTGGREAAVREGWYRLRAAIEGRDMGAVARLRPDPGHIST